MSSRLFKRLAAACLLVGAALASPGFAADIVVKTWRTEDGLPDTTITAILQTRDGYLWIGTPVGLARFDGVRFVPYSISNLPELGSSPVAKLFEDRGGTLWIALESGRLLAWKDGVARIHLPDAKSAGEAVVAMAADAGDTLWVQTADGRLGRLTAGGLELVAHTGPVSHRSRLGLARDEHGALWVGTKDGLKIWDRDRLVSPPGLGALTGLPVDALAQAGEGGLWAYADHRLWRIRDGQIVREMKGPAEFSGNAVAMVESADRQPWVATEGGGVFYLDESGGWQLIDTELGLRNGNLTLYQDREGNLWRGSAGGGLTRMRRNFFRLHDVPGSRFDRRSLSVSADADGNAWALLNSRILVSIDTEERRTKSWRTGAPTSHFRVLFSDRQGSIWCGGWQGMLYRLRDGTLVPELTVDPSATAINAFFEDADATLWIGFSGGAGVGRMPAGDPAGWQTLKGAPNSEVCAIGQAADGSMWFGTIRSGAFRLKDGQWLRLTAHDGLPSEAVRCFHMAADGTVWLGTQNGLVRWRKGACATVTTANGLWNDVIHHIADDQRGNFWIGSSGGVFRVPQQQLNEFADGGRDLVQCVAYNRNDGLVAQECSGGVQPAGARTPDGRLWFPTADGLVSIDPARAADNRLPPPVRIEEIIVEGIPREIRRTDSLVEAAAGKNRIEFRFTALSLMSPEKVRFRYRLDGVDRTWSPPDGQRSAVYPLVPPGRYTFRVIACNNAGLWSPTEASLALVVRPFFWQTAWFKGGLGLVLVAFLGWSVRLREQRKARLALERLQSQHAIERERARIAKDIHDDIGARLTQIAFLSERVGGAGQGVPEVERWNRRIAETAWHTIQSLDEIVWAVSPEHDTLEGLADYLAGFTQKHLELAGVRCQLNIPAVLPDVTLNAEIRHSLLLAAREALQNIVVHATATEATVTLEWREDALEICLADNGRGLAGNPPAAGGNGLGNMRKRMEEMAGSLEVASRPGSGTTVRFIVPRARLIAASEPDTPPPDPANDTMRRERSSRFPPG